MTDFHIYRGDRGNWPYTIVAGGKWDDECSKVAEVTTTLWGARLWIKLHGRKFARELAAPRTHVEKVVR